MLLRFGFLAAAAMVMMAAHAEQPAAGSHFPDRPLRLIVGYTPGGGVDIMARLIQQPMSEALGQTVVVENRPGASQNIGAQYVAHSPADGYTLFTSSSALAVNISLFPKLDYDPVKDFTPIALFAQSPNVLVVRSGLDVNSVADLIAYEKHRKSAGNFSSSGPGSTQHLCGELFNLRTGLKVMHIPYKGTAPSVSAVMSGEVDYTFMNIPSAKGLIASHQLKALAVTSGKRSPLLPDVPTMAEAGVPDMDVQAWYGILGPANMPPDVVKRLNSVIVQAVKQPAFQEKLLSMGADPISGSPQMFQKFLAQDIQRWAGVVHAAKIKLQ
ncbi:hypothetical protein CAL29_06095 [Bordetella genomosp. 10]|uniref:MFS transporter n=1 Tax=Bordetella genomosp. 10 TaxID=1416804 RepID=A0A261SLV3_9BORD|nr:tripartite tricarboxylate transporter substrate binding protein [Bordetella genomosp. 10]OZI37932.1 hypothetical protein CAL29_06095 [Bordetella genomosp. 10]